MSKTVGPDNLVPENEWIDIVNSGNPGRNVVESSEARRWVLESDGIITMWGEGVFHFDFDKMYRCGHDISGYRLLVGERVGMVTEQEYEVVTPQGYVVGSTIGNVSHQSPKESNPDIRATPCSDPTC